MKQGKVQAYYGYGRGKTSAALGHAIQEASKGGNCVVLQFLKERDDDEIEFARRLEPQIKLFRFQKSADLYDNLSEDVKFEEELNMKNGLNYARKVLVTGECSLLVLDEVLGLLDKKILTTEELVKLLQARTDETTVILTGRVMDEALLPYIDQVYRIHTEKE